MLIFKFLRKQNFRLEKSIFLPKKCNYFVTYRNEHPVFICQFIYLNLKNLSIYIFPLFIYLPIYLSMNYLSLILKYIKKYMTSDHKFVKTANSAYIWQDFLMNHEKYRNMFFLFHLLFY